MINIINKNKTYITSNGFTLAEVLITLGIIGIVAAMTLPTIVTKYRQYVAINKIKKMYSSLSQAMLYAVRNEDNEILTDIIDMNNKQSIKNWYTNVFKNTLNITKECYETPGCWAEQAYTLNNKKASYDRGNIGIGYGIINFNTADGYTINLDAFEDYGNFVGINLDHKYYVVIYIDINGKQNPNIIGKDIYFLAVSNKGLIPAGHDKSDAEINSNCSKNGTGYYCLEKIMRNGWKIDKENLW